MGTTRSACHRPLRDAPACSAGFRTVAAAVAPGGGTMVECARDGPLRPDRASSRVLPRMAPGSSLQRTSSDLGPGSSPADLACTPSRSHRVTDELWPWLESWHIPRGAADQPQRGTYGFASEVAFLPEANLGIVILTNARTPFAAFNYAVQFRLLELLFDQPSEIDGQLSALPTPCRPPVRSSSASSIPRLWPLPRSLCQPELGVVSLSFRGIGWYGRWRTQLGAAAPPDGRREPTIYLFHDPPLSLISEGNFGTVRFEGGDGTSGYS